MKPAMRLAILMSILAVAARFILIDQPYIDNWSWRQSDVAAIARTYFQGGFHFARPQTDWPGNESGYVGTEFPVLPVLPAACYTIFAVHVWVGRAQALLLVPISLSILIKLPSILVGAPLACLALQRFGSSSFKRFDLWFLAAIALLPSVFWYGHAYQIALQFYPHHFFGAGGVQIMSAAWYLKIVKEIVTSTLTPFVFVLGSVGVLVTRTCPERQSNGSIPRPRDATRMFHWWLAAMI